MRPLVTTTNQLRYYTYIQAFFYLSNCFAYWLAFDRFTGTPAFRVLNDLVGLRVWVVVLGVMGVLLLCASIFPRLSVIRALLSLSVGIKVLFGISLLVSNWSPGGFSYLALAATDLLVAASPTRMRLRIPKASVE